MHVEEKDVSERQKSALAATSNELVKAVEELKKTEERKRQAPIASAAFKSLANDVDALSLEVWSLAHDQHDAGNRIPLSDETIEDVSNEDMAQGDA